MESTNLSKTKPALRTSGAVTGNFGKAKVKSGSTLSDHAVNGISGATLTGNGVEALVRKDAAAYAEYFNSIKGN